MMKYLKIFLSVIIAALAIGNIVLLFAFEYEIFGFKWMDLHPVNNSSTAVTTVATAGTTEAAETIVDEITEGDTSDETQVASTDMSTSVEEKERKCVVTSSKNARIRSGPGTEYKHIASVPRNTVLYVIDVEDDGWVHIRTEDGTEGYISGDLVEMIEE